MSGYRRFVAYVYEYLKGKKRKQLRIYQSRRAGTAM